MNQLSISSVETNFVFVFVFFKFAQCKFLRQSIISVKNVTFHPSRATSGRRKCLPRKQVMELNFLKVSHWECAKNVYEMM